MRRSQVDVKLAQRLRELREHSGMTQARLGSRVRITGQAVSRYETSKVHIPIERAEEMMRAMGFEMHHLHEEPGSPLPPVRFRPEQDRPAALMPRRVSRVIGNWIEPIAVKLPDYVCAPCRWSDRP